MNSDRIVSIAAIVVSIATLVMILYQTNLMRKEQKSSVMPSLAVGYSVNENNGEITEKIWLSNRGLGPAFIEKVAVIDKGKAHDMDPYGYISKIRSITDKETKTINRLYAGRIIPAKDGIVLYEKKTDSTSQIVLSNLFEFPYEIENMPSGSTEKAVIEIGYKNVYDDKWKVRSDSTSPIVLDD